MYASIAIIKMYFTIKPTRNGSLLHEHATKIYQDRTDGIESGVTL